MRGPVFGIVAMLGACSFRVPAADEGNATTDAQMDPDGGTDRSWHDPAWPHRKRLTIDTSQVPAGGVTEFAVLLSHTDEDLRDNARPDGGDLLFTASDGTTKLAHEVESYDRSTGALLAWVKVPSLSPTAPTNVYMYYGHAAATDQQEPAHVWDPSFRGVWHLGALTDSTSHGNDGTATGSPALGATGKIGNAVRFAAGGTDRLDMGSSASLDFGAGDFTVSAWILPTDGDRDWQAIVAKASGSSPYRGWVLQIAPTDRHVNMWVDRSDDAASAAVTIGAWSYIVWTRSAGVSRLYVNGEQTATGTSTDDVDVPQQPLTMGFTDAWLDWAGTLDEVRLSGVARSSTWIATEYANQSSPASFVSVVGPEERVPP